MCTCRSRSPVLARSCCCYALDHGTVIIGIVSMLASTVAVLLEIGLIAEWPDIASEEGDISTAVSRPVLIVSLGLSAAYWLFSIFLLKAVKEVRRGEERSGLLVTDSLGICRETVASLCRGWPGRSFSS